MVNDKKCFLGNGELTLLCVFSVSPDFSTFKADEQFFLDPNMLAMMQNTLFFNNTFQQFALDDGVLKEFVRKQMWVYQAGRGWILEGLTH